MNAEKIKVITNSFITSHFSYFHLIWIVYKDTDSSFDKLLVMGNSVSDHQRNLLFPMTEIYKTKNNLSFIEDIFVKKTNTYNLRKNDGRQMPRAMQLLIVLKPYDTLEVDFRKYCKVK